MLDDFNNIVCALGLASYTTMTGENGFRNVTDIVHIFQIESITFIMENISFEGLQLHVEIIYLIEQSSMRRINMLCLPPPANLVFDFN